MKWSSRPFQKSSYVYFVDNRLFMHFFLSMHCLCALFTVCQSIGTKSAKKVHICMQNLNAQAVRCFCMYHSKLFQNDKTEIWQLTILMGS